MEEAGMIAQLRSETSGVRALGKVDKIYLENTNLMNQLSRKNQNLGNLRETYFLNQTKTLHTVNSSTLGDFNIDDKDFEVGGKNRGLKQIAKSSDGFVVKNDIERGYPQLISLWQLGLIYWELQIESLTLNWIIGAQKDTSRTRITYHEKLKSLSNTWFFSYIIRN